ncbi:hypothetical protein [Kitasatospora sp. NPDC087315]|uniref:hypothetical protein n=1 Tax=Kitasatospora sp. NPDC087315 TaxID=3364069 RepID=UPI0037F4CE64
MPGIARVRITGDDQAVDTVTRLLAERFTTTAPSHYPGGRAYLEVDTRTITPETHDA